MTNLSKYLHSKELQKFFGCGYELSLSLYSADLADIIFGWLSDNPKASQDTMVMVSGCTSCGAGLLAGLLFGRVRSVLPMMAWGVPVFLMIGLAVPYLKPLIAPLDLNKLNAHCPNNICLQTSEATCGPASVASILRLFSIKETEKTIASETFTYRGGTENWYLARALRKRGFSVKYLQKKMPVQSLPVPSIAGVIMPEGFGHFIAVLGEDEKSYIIGEPLLGRLEIPKANLANEYTFTGFFMAVGQ